MALRSLVPWTRNRPVAAPFSGQELNPFVSLHREMNRLFDDFFRGFEMPANIAMPWGGTWPRVEVSENDKEVHVVAELPGMSEKDVEVAFADGILTLEGEKKAETTSPLYTERWQGRFSRSVSIGSDVDPDKVQASFKNGVLTVILQKRPEAQSKVRKITVNAS